MPILSYKSRNLSVKERDVRARDTQVRPTRHSFRYLLSHLSRFIQLAAVVAISEINDAINYAVVAYNALLDEL